MTALKNRFRNKKGYIEVSFRVAESLFYGNCISLCITLYAHVAITASYVRIQAYGGSFHGKGWLCDATRGRHTTTLSSSD